MDEAPIAVLNVNDDAATRYVMTKILRRGGYEVLEAATGETALQIVHRQRPDLVLLDIKLPDTSGLEVCRRIKADPATAATLVIQTSATFASSDRKVEGLDSGAEAYLTQPIEPLELLATVRAVLRTRRAEIAAQRAANRLQRTFEAIQDAMFLVDRAGVVERCNDAAARLVERDRSRLIGASCVEVLKGIVASDRLSQMLDGAGAVRRELEARSGPRRWRLSADPVLDEDGAIEGTVLIVSDVTERRRLEEEARARAEELAEAARRKDEFLGMLAHELRNPLNAISAANSLLERGPVDGERARLCSIVSRQTQHLARLVDDLLEVSRITRGRLDLRKRPLDLGQLVRLATQGTQGLVAARQQALVVQLPDEPVIVDGDDLRLEQVVSNLLANASKYSEPRRTITVSLTPPRADGKAVTTLRVRDEGIGVPAEMLEAIFEPFVQVDQSLSRSLGGLGIGLTMVRSLVDLHGGRVWATSAGLGRGTEIVVELPVSEEIAEAPASVASPLHAREGGSLRILVVEDNLDALELVRTWLEMLGHDVQGVSDGRSGLERALEERPDLALVDIGLPGLDGYEVAKSLRAADATRHTYLVALTGYGRPEDKARALDAGFDAWVVKPIDEEKLRKVLAAQAQERRRTATWGDGAESVREPG